MPSRSETRLLESLVSDVEDVEDVLLSLLNSAASKELAPLDDPMPLVDMDVSFRSTPPDKRLSISHAQLMVVIFSGFLRVTGNTTNIMGLVDGRNFLPSPA